MRFIRNLAAAAVCIALASATRANAQTGVPVAIASCQMGISSMYRMDAALIDARFKNTAGATADKIDFRIWWGDGTVDTVHDVGTFAPGVTIRHNWYVGLSIRPIVPRLWDYVRASVSRVHYVDGTEWTSPFARLTDDAEYAAEKPLSTNCHVYPT
jgi:hypothetical protein